MPLTPSIDMPDIKKDKVHPSKTYKVDFVNKRILGYIDGKEAVKQFIMKALKTARFRYPIYNSDYGCEIEELIGNNLSERLFQSEVKRLITEAIVYDSRINRVYDFHFHKNENTKDSVIVDFTVDTVEGEMNIREVI